MDDRDFELPGAGADGSSGDGAPEDGKEKKRHPLLSRRNFVAGAIALGAAAMFAPRLSWAVGQGAWGNWGWPLEHGAGNFGYDCGWSYAHHDVYGFPGGTQKPHVSSSTNASCEYSNELYDMLTVNLYIAGGPQGLWTKGWGTGTTGYIGATGYKEDHVDINMYTDYGHGTGYNWYWGKSFWYRRQNSDRNIYCYANTATWGIHNTAWDGQWIWSCVPDDSYPYQIQPHNYLNNRWELFGGAWIVKPAHYGNGSQCLDVAGGGGSDSNMILWDYYGSTSQIWLVNASGVDSANTGHLHDLYPAHMPTMALTEPGGVNGPSTDAVGASNAKIYVQRSGMLNSFGYSERHYWINYSEGRYYITCDATGRVLDLADGGSSNGTAIRFHSSGYDNEWSNQAHQWLFEEVRFGGSISMPEKYELDVGTGVTCPDPSSTCKPYDAFNTGQTPYIYRWMTTDARAAAEEDGARVMGAYMTNAWGSRGLDGRYGIEDGIPAYRYIGLPYEMWSDEIRVTDFTLWLADTQYEGTLECTARLADGSEMRGSFGKESGTWLNGRSDSTDIVGVEFWLEGEIAEHYDLDYRAYNRVGHWSQHCYTDGDGNHPVAGDMSTSLGCFQIHMVPKPAGATVVREWSTEATYMPTEDDADKYLHCLCRLSAVQPTAASCAAAGGDYGDHDWMLDRFQGTVASSITYVIGDPDVYYYVDGEEQYCYKDKAKRNVTYTPPAEAKAAAQKEGCLEVSGWFTDPEYTTPYVPCGHTKDFNLYAYNSCSLEYDTTTTSCVLDSTYNWKADEAQTVPLDLSATYPARAVVRWGTEVTFAGPWSAWCTDMGKTRKVTSTPGVYASRSASGNPLLKAAVKKNSTVFVDWPWAGYDGVISGWD